MTAVLINSTPGFCIPRKMFMSLSIILHVTMFILGVQKTENLIVKEEYGMEIETKLDPRE